MSEFFSFVMAGILILVIGTAGMGLPFVGLYGLNEFARFMNSHKASSVSSLERRCKSEAANDRISGICREYFKEQE